MGKICKLADFLTGGFNLYGFNDNQLEKIHEACTDILANNGIFVEHPEALEIFDGLGCEIDKSTNVVKIPRDIVDKAIESAPAQFTLAGRDPAKNVEMKGGGMAFASFGGGLRMNDPNTGEYRDSTKRDLSAATLLQDALSEYSIVNRAVNALDADQRFGSLHNFEAMMAYTTKPLSIGPDNGKHLEVMYEMASLAMGGKENLQKNPMVLVAGCLVSPMRMVNHGCDIIMTAARWKMPVRWTSMVLAGATGPISLAGTFIVQNTEFLAGLVLHQGTQKGAPMVYGNASGIMEMSSGDASVGAPEDGMLTAFSSIMARRYSVPTWSAGG
jgi:trimethylamine--corrinoid protein Co-methyltransferase